jgi:hypothetical protein
MRTRILRLQEEILNNSYFSGIHSLEKRKDCFYFHAKDDVPEIREKFFSLIKTLDFKAYIIVARKIEAIFQNKYNSNPNVFYNAMVAQLFRKQLVE